jgi:tetratricopeptide (TPR) repeat protein
MLSQLCLLTWTEACFAQVSPWQTHMQDASTACENRDFKTAESLYRKALREAEQVFGPDDPRCAVTLNDLGRVLFDDGNYRESELILRRSLAIPEKAGAVENMQFANSLVLLGIVLEKQAKYADAEPLLKRALAIKGKVSGTTSKAYALGLKDVANNYVDEGKYAIAEPLFTQAMKMIGQADMKPDDPDLASIYSSLASLYKAQGKPAAAEPLCKRALALFQNHPNSERYLSYLNNLADCYEKEGQYTEAESLLKKVVDGEQRLLGPQNPRLAIGVTNLGLCYFHQGRYEEAESCFKRALNLNENAFGSQNPLVANSLENLGSVFEDTNRLAEAEPLMRKALTIREQTQGVAHPALEGTLKLLARLYLKMGKFHDAEPLFKRALEIQEQNFGKDDRKVATILEELANVYDLEHRPALAEPVMLRALAIHEKIGGKKSPAVAADLDKLAKLYLQQRKPQDAPQLSKRADEIKAILPGSTGRNVLPKTSVALPSAHASKPVKDKWALVIGISNFKDPSINLQYSAKDATDFRNYLIADAHFKPDHVKLLTDSAATRDNIIGQLGDRWLGRAANPGDLVVVYFSSHGSTAKREVGVNFLVAYDTNKNSLIGTGIPMQWITKIIAEQVHCDRVVLILDVCHSGAVASAGKGLTRVDGFDVKKMAVEKGQAVLCSSLSDQISWESKNYRNSVFTRKLIESLRRKGDKIKLGEAYSFLKDDVESEVLRDRGELQTPVLNEAGWRGEDAVLSVTPASPRAGL